MTDSVVPYLGLDGRPYSRREDVLGCKVGDVTARVVEVTQWVVETEQIGADANGYAISTLTHLGTFGEKMDAVDVFCHEINRLSGGE